MNSISVLAITGDNIALAIAAAALVLAYSQHRRAAAAEKRELRAEEQAEKAERRAERAERREEEREGREQERLERERQESDRSKRAVLFLAGRGVFSRRDPSTDEYSLRIKVRNVGTVHAREIKLDLADASGAKLSSKRSVVRDGLDPGEQKFTHVFAIGHPPDEYTILCSWKDDLGEHVDEKLA